MENLQKWILQFYISQSIEILTCYFLLIYGNSYKITKLLRPWNWKIKIIWLDWYLVIFQSTSYIFHPCQTRALYFGERERETPTGECDDSYSLKLSLIPWSLKKPWSHFSSPPLIVFFSRGWVGVWIQDQSMERKLRAVTTSVIKGRTEASSWRHMPAIATTWFRPFAGKSPSSAGSANSGNLFGSLK